MIMLNKLNITKTDLRNLERELQELETTLLESKKRLEKLKEQSHGIKTEADKLVQSAREVSNGRFAMQ